MVATQSHTNQSNRYSIIRPLAKLFYGNIKGFDFLVTHRCNTSKQNNCQIGWEKAFAECLDRVCTGRMFSSPLYTALWV